MNFFFKGGVNEGEGGVLSSGWEELSGWEALSDSSWWNKWLIIKKMIELC